MTFSNINISNPNDGLGDKLRDAFAIVNENFTEVNTIISDSIDVKLTDYATIEYVNDETTAIDAEILSILTRLGNDELDIAVLQTDLTNLSILLEGKASLTQLNDAFSTLNDTISNLNITIEEKIGDAPNDGQAYVRINGNWDLLSNYLK